MSPAKPEDLVFLEIKKKIGGIVNKRRITLTLKEAEAYLQRGIHLVDNGKYVRRMVLEELDHFCGRYAPLVQSSISAISERHFSERMTQISG